MATLAGRLPSSGELMQLSIERGVDLATVVLYRSILASPLHAGFARAVSRSSPPSTAPARSAYEVVVVPSSTPGYGPKWGSFVDPVRSWAREAGYATDSADTLRSGSIAGNARVLSDLVAEKPADAKLVFVTFGQGASELRYFLQKRGPEHADMAKVRGWINVAGSYGGLAAFDRKLEDPFRRAWAKTSAMLLGRSYSAIAEASSRFSMWREPFQPPRRMLTMNLVGFPMRWHLPRGLRSSYDAIGRRGPNDGALLLTDAMARPGLVCPVWGLHHRSGPDDWMMTLSRALRVMLETLERPATAADARPDLSVEMNETDPEIRAERRREEVASARLREAKSRARKMLERAKAAAARREEVLTREPEALPREPEAPPRESDDDAFRFF